MLLCFTTIIFMMTLFKKIVPLKTHYMKAVEITISSVQLSYVYQTPCRYSVNVNKYVYCSSFMTHRT